MFVFDAHHHDEPNQWKLATVIEITAPTQSVRTRSEKEWQGLVTAKVAWRDGSVSDNHLVQRMRYPHAADTPYVYL